MLRTTSSSILRAAVAAVSVISCLPKDTRPPPGSLDVTATADSTLLGGGRSISTSDGWTVSYDRFLIAISSQLSGDSTCASYYTDGYRRIFDMGFPGPQKVNLLYALGHCNFGFRVASADPDPLEPLGEGVTQADKNLMATADTDFYTKEPTGIALYAKGKATKGDVTKTFTWSFRQRISYQRCAEPAVPGDAAGADDAAGGDDAAGADAELDANELTGPQGVDLAGGDAKSVDIRIHGESLFLDSTDPTKGALRFDVIAAADDMSGDHDGDVTLLELHKISLSDISVPGRYQQPPPSAGAAVPDSGNAAWTTLEDFVYLGLVPKVARFEDKGTCSTMPRRGD
jgi:hypothetical protein